MKRVLFIHRSVGHNLLQDGEVYRLIAEAGSPFELDDYDQNTDTLTDNLANQTHLGFVFPGGNTRPEDFAVLFSDTVPPEYKSILDMIMDHDVIVLKSCYPNSNIKSDMQLKSMQENYESIFGFFRGHPNKQLAILTSPPMMPLLTNARAAARARKLANLLAQTDLAGNIHVFNFFDLLATPEGKRQANTLRKSYRRWVPIDSRPNSEASKLIAPQFVEFLKSIVV